VGFLVTILFAISSAFAQTNSPPAIKHFHVDCTTVHATKSCDSFNELITQQDKDVMDDLKGGAFVCFLSDEDAFAVVTTTIPDDKIFSHTSVKNLMQVNSVEFYKRFKNGLNDETRIVEGTWAKAVFNEEDPPRYSFESSKTGDTTLSIDPSEIFAQYKFQNLRKSSTTYTLQIRRSTRRFVETYGFPAIPPSDPKAKAAFTPHDEKLESTGYCAEFN